MKPSTTRKTTGSIALMAAVALTLGACGGPSTDGGDQAEEEATDWSGVEPAEEIVFWSNHPGSSVEQEEALIEAFTEETGITVSLENSGATYEETSQAFQTAQGTDTLPDVVVLSDATWFPNYLNDSLIAVDDVLAAADVDTAGYVEALYEDYNYEGAHYGVPYARSTPLFYYNVDHYTEAGIEGPPETWEDVAENSRTLIDAGVVDAGFAFPPQDEYPAWWMQNLIWGYGGGWSEDWDFSPITSEGTVEAIQFAQDATNDWATVSSGDPADDFGSGAVSQIVQSTGSLGGILDIAEFEVGAAFLPSGPEAEGETPTGGAGLMISSASTPEEQLAAAMFLGFVTNAENTATFSQATGYMPVQQDVDMAEVYAETPQFEVAVEQLSRARSQDNARVLLPGGDLELSQALQRILTSDVDVTEELTGVQTSLEELYESDLAPQLD